MLHFPTIFGYLVAKLPGRKLRRQGRHGRRAIHRGIPYRAGQIPIGLYKTRAAKDNSLRTGAREPVECCVFRYCDLLYQQLPQAERDKWQAAIKKSGISAYDNWMSECMAVALLRKRPPDNPSISGGWSSRKAIPGTTHDFAPCWPEMVHRPPFVACGAEHADGDPWNIVTMWVEWADDVLDYPPEERNIDWWSWRIPPLAWHWQGWFAYPQTERRSPGWSVDHIHPVACQWPVFLPPRATLPSMWGIPWDIRDPNAKPWPGHPLPPPPWPNPLA